MSDIFISYAKVDRERVEALVKALARRGWSVWWDDKISAGMSWDKDIEKELKEAKCVLVLWSKASVESDWVRTEAEEGRKRNILIPALLENVDIPLGFRRIQTANLKNWQGVEPDQGLDELIKAINYVFDRPPVPEPIPVAPSPLWTSKLLIAVVSAPLVIGTLLYLVQIRQTEIGLDVKLSELSFVLSRQEDLSDLMVVSAIRASGLKEIHLPGSRGRSDQTIEENDKRGRMIQLVPAHGSQRLGTITLAPLSLPGGTHVTVRTGPDRYQYRISFNGSKLPIRVNVHGSIRVLFAQGTPESIDYGSPRPILLLPDENGADLDITLSGAARNLLPDPLSVNALSLLRIDERIEEQRTVVQKVSTVLAGTLSLESLGGQKQVLASGEEIRFATSQGEIRSLQLNEDHLRLEFRGNVQGMKTCSGNACKSWTPTPFQWLRAHYGPPLVFAGILYLFSVLIASLWYWKHKQSSR